MRRTVCLIPTLNEGPSVGEVIRKARKLVDKVVVVDGHSDDETPEMAKIYGAEVLVQEGFGKGMAIRTAFKKVDEDILVIIDGDSTYDASEIDSLVQPILRDEADMVVGSRLIGKMEEGAMTSFHRLGNNGFNALINLLTGSHITDSQSGFRVIKGVWARSLSLVSTSFEVETEITMKALKHGLRITEIPISYRKRVKTVSKLSGFRAGWRILKTIIRCSLEKPVKTPA
jgi:glycosyltransferase involved in cell wall biosynthesis